MKTPVDSFGNTAANAALFFGVLSLGGMVATFVGVAELNAVLAPESDRDPLGAGSAQLMALAGLALAIASDVGALVATLISYRGVRPHPVKQAFMWVLAVVPAVVSVVVFYSPGI